MTKKEDLIKNPYHDMEDEYRDNLEDRWTGLTLIIFILALMAIAILGLHFLIQWIRPV